MVEYNTRIEVKKDNNLKETEIKTSYVSDETEIKTSYVSDETEIKISYQTKTVTNVNTSIKQG
ncbi:MAG: hypothetical protein K6G11_10660 [Lachnospiraceae bacterium]|nr:hypothetical protein [Lachnospiraceae bacterium]